VVPRKRQRGEKLIVCKSIPCAPAASYLPHEESLLDSAGVVADSGVTLGEGEVADLGMIVGEGLVLFVFERLVGCTASCTGDCTASRPNPLVGGA